MGTGEHVCLAQNRVAARISVAMGSPWDRSPPRQDEERCVVTQRTHRADQTEGETGPWFSKAQQAAGEAVSFL